MLSALPAWGALPEVHQVDGGEKSWSSWLVVVVVVEGIGAQRGACYTHSSGWGMKSLWQPASGSTELREYAVGIGPTSKDNKECSRDLTVAMVVMVMGIWVVVMMMMMARKMKVIKGMLKMLTIMASGTCTEKRQIKTKTKTPKKKV